MISSWRRASADGRSGLSSLKQMGVANEDSTVRTAKGTYEDFILVSPLFECLLVKDQPSRGKAHCEDMPSLLERAPHRARTQYPILSARISGDGRPKYGVRDVARPTVSCAEVLELSAP